MTDLAAVAGKIEKELKVAFKEAKIGGHACLAAPVKDAPKLTEQLRPRAVAMERSGQLLFVGLHGKDRAHRLFLLPELGSLDVVRLFKVGTHNQDDGAWKDVDKALRKIHAEAPFSVYFADAAGYKAAFAGKVSRKLAKRFEQIIYEVNLDAVVLNEDRAMWSTIELQGIFQLWWD